MKKQKTFVFFKSIFPFLVISLICFFIFYVSNNFFGTNNGSSANSSSTYNQGLTLIAALIAASASILNTLSAYWNLVQLEEIKQKMSIKLPAIQETANAAIQYYYALSKLEKGVHNADGISKSDEEMQRVAGKVFFLDKEYQDEWYAYWQQARFISEMIENQNDLQVIELWKKDWSGKLATHLKKISSLQEII